MTPNVKLLKKVRKLIAEEPRRLSMTNWMRTVGEEGDDIWNRPAPACGTVACLAGWAILAGTPRNKFRERVKRIWRYVERADYVVHDDFFIVKAAKLLRIPQEQCPFMRTDWNERDVLEWIDEQIEAAQQTKE